MRASPPPALGIAVCVCHLVRLVLGYGSVGETLKQLVSLVYRVKFKVKQSAIEDTTIVVFRRP